MANSGFVNKFELEGTLAEPVEVYHGANGNIGNFKFKFPCTKAGEYGEYRCSTFHESHIEKLENMAPGTPILLKGRINEDHYEYKGNPAKTKKLIIDELLVKLGTAQTAGAPPPVAAASGTPPAATQATPPDQAEAQPPQTGADVPAPEQWG